MQKKPLKVQPAKRIYTPSYPSYADKNPLLYPETRPYPFRHKFIKWMSTGGLASMMLLSANELSAQSKVDSLYNPFLLENARVPYQPVSFGTGMPERLQSEEARQAIRRAFADSGIELEEEVWLEDANVGVFLDGYSAKEKIGFVYMDYSNMDGSFAKSNRAAAKRLRQEARAGNKNNDLKTELKAYQERVKNTFLTFVEDKTKYMDQHKRYYSKQASGIRFGEQLSSLEPQLEQETLFNTYYLEYQLAGIREQMESKNDFTKEIFLHLEDRFSDTAEKKVLMRFVHQFKKKESYTNDFYSRFIVEFRALKKIKSDEKFIENFLILNKFLKYKIRLQGEEAFQKLKLEIMDDYPLKKWFKHLDKVDFYYDQSYITLSEARRMDLNNKKGTQFIAPICVRDPLTIIPERGHFVSEDLMQERIKLTEAFNEKNGMTKEILAQRKADYQELAERYPWDKLKNLSREKRDSIQKIKKQERAEIKAKYEAMEQISEEDRAAFKLKFEDIRRRQKERQAAHAEEGKLETLRRLEEEVKRYIQWAKSQMGS